MTTFYDDAQNTHNPATGTAIPASWGDKVRDNQQFFAQPPSVSVYRDTAQSMTNGWDAVDFPSERWDTDSFHDVSTNNSRITIPTGFGGKYLITASGSYVYSGTGNRGMAIYVDGVTSHVSMFGSPSASPNSTVMNLAGILELSAGSYIELYVQQNTGGALNLGNAHLQMIWVSL